MKASLRKRLATLEMKQKGEDERGWEEEAIEALQRVRTALGEALFPSRQEQQSDGPHCHGRILLDPELKNFADYVCELHQRIVSESATTEDSKVLASLPVDDLDRLQMTAEEIVAMYDRIFTTYCQR